MVDIQSATAEIRRENKKKKKEDRRHHGTKIECPHLLRRAAMMSERGGRCVPNVAACPVMLMMI